MLGACRPWGDDTMRYIEVVGSKFIKLTVNYGHDTLVVNEFAVGATIDARTVPSIISNRAIPNPDADSLISERALSGCGRKLAAECQLEINSPLFQAVATVRRSQGRASALTNCGAVRPLISNDLQSGESWRLRRFRRFRTVLAGAGGRPKNKTSGLAAIAAGGLETRVPTSLGEGGRLLRPARGTSCLGAINT